MIVSFSNNPIDRLYCYISNTACDIKDKRWRNGRHRCRCHVCGTILNSQKDKWCPESCGWMRLKQKKIRDPWICHSCLEHHDNCWIRKE